MILIGNQMVEFPKVNFPMKNINFKAQMYM